MNPTRIRSTRLLVAAAVVVLASMLHIVAPQFGLAESHGAISATPSSVAVGYEGPVSVSVLGDETDFVAGGTTVTIRDGDSETTGAASNVGVSSGTALSFALGQGLVPDTYTIRVQTAEEVWETAFLVVEPTIENASPMSVAVGYSNPVSVTLTGADTSWTEGQTTVNLLQNGNAVGTITGLTVESATELSFSIGTGLAAGGYTIRTSTEGRSASISFTVRDPQVSLDPASVSEGYSSGFSVSATGIETNFVDGATTVSLVQDGVSIGSVTGVTVVSATELAFNLGAGLEAGNYTVRIASGSETTSAQFSVIVPTISLSPAEVNEGYANPISVTVTGINTNFVDGQTVVSLLDTQGNTAGNVSSLDVQSPTEVQFNIPTGLEPASYVIRAATGNEVATSAFGVLESSVSISPSSVAVGYAGPVSITATGINTSFVSDQTQVSLLNPDNSPAASISTPSVNSATGLTFSIPSGIGEGEYTVRITTGAQSITIGFVVRPKVIAFDTDPYTLAANRRSQAMRVELRDAGDNPVAADANVTLNLTSSSPGGGFYTAALGGSPTTSMTLAQGDSSATFYYEDTRPGPSVVTVETQMGQETGVFGQASQVLTIDEATIASVTVGNPGPLSADSRSGAIILQPLDIDGQPVTVASDTTMSLNSTSTEGRFYVQPTGGGSVSSVTLDGGSNSVEVYYRDTVAGTPSITTAIGTMEGVRQLSVIPASADHLRIVTTPHTVESGQRTGAIALELRDAFSNTITAASQRTIDISANSGTGRFYLQPSGGSLITQASLTSGESRVTVYYEDNTAGVHTLTANAAGVGHATQFVTITAPQTTPVPTPMPSATPAQTPTPSVAAPTPTPLPPLTIVPESEIVSPPPSSVSGGQGNGLTQVVQPNRETMVNMPEQGLTVRFSPGSYGETLQSRMQPVEPEAITTAPTIALGTETQMLNVVEISLFHADGTPVTEVRLWQPVTISMRLSQEDVAALGGVSQLFQLYLQGQLGIFRSPDGGGAWTPLTTSFDLATRTFTASVTGFSVFALSAPGEVPMPTPTPMQETLPAPTPTQASGTMPTPVTTQAPGMTPTPTQTVVGMGESSGGLSLALIVIVVVVLAGGSAAGYLYLRRS